MYVSLEKYYNNLYYKSQLATYVRYGKQYTIYDVHREGVNLAVHMFDENDDWIVEILGDHEKIEITLIDGVEENMENF